MQNQVYMFECIQEILSRLDWRGSAKEADPTKFESHKPVKGSIPVGEGGKITPTGESDFKKQAKEIAKRAIKNIEEEPL